MLISVGIWLSGGPKRSLPIAVLFYIWELFVSGLFVGFTLWPDEVWVTSTEIRGRHNFRFFSVPRDELERLTTSRSLKGGYFLHAIIRSSNDGVGLPIIDDRQNEPYKAALRSSCPEGQAWIDW